MQGLNRGDLGVIGDRFEVIEVLGEGAQGRTYLARDADGDRVALKELDLSHADDWKAIELFEREGQILRHLDHPAIPRYVDAFHVPDDSGTERFFLAQEHVEGDDLDSLVEQGKTWTEAEARQLTAQVLEILVYLQQRSPPVIHRDIKPSNLILRPDGRVALIDFGAVQAVLPGGKAGSTVVGTSGYMPVEQLMGRAVAATDLYAVGVTIIHLLSRRHPADLPVRNMALQFRSAINVSERFADFLGRLVEVDVDQRFATAQQALAALRNLDRQPTPAPTDVSAGKHISVWPVLGLVFAMVAFILAAVAVPTSNCGRLTSKMMDYEELVMAPLHECGLAAELLGDDVEVPWLGFQNGQTKTGNDSGVAHWTYPVAGSQGSGKYRFLANKHRGQWSLGRATLIVDGEYYDLLACQAEDQ